MSEGQSVGHQKNWEQPMLRPASKQRRSPQARYLRRDLSHPWADSARAHSRHAAGPGENHRLDPDSQQTADMAVGQSFQLLPLAGWLLHVTTQAANSYQ